MTNLTQNFAMFHYTNPKAWNRVNKGNQGYTYEDWHTYEDLETGRIKYVDGKDVTGLWPSRRLIAEGADSLLVPRQATRPTIFGLLEEKPKSWIEYEDCIKIFDYLMKCCAGTDSKKSERSLILLKANLIPQDKPLVVDYLHIRHLSRDFTNEQDPQLKRKILAEGNKNYWDSRVPLAEYKGDYTLPEVIVWNPIPLERVNFIWGKNLDSFLEEIHQ